MPKWLNLGFYYAVALFFHDVIAIYVAIRIVHAYRIEWLKKIDLLPILVIVLVTLMALYVMNVYQFHRRRSATNMALRTFFAVAIAGLIMSSFLYATKSTDVTTVFWRGNLPLAMLLFALWASIIRYTVTVIYDRTVWRPNWLVVGNDQEVEAMISEHSNSMSPGTMRSVSMSEFSQMLERDSSAQQDNTPSGIILASHRDLSDAAVQRLMQIRLSGTPIVGLADFYEQYLLKIPVHQLKDSWFVFSGGFSLVHHDIALKVKRLVDVFLAAIGLILLAPVMAVVAITVAVSSKGPILYIQERHGQFRRVFRLRKFRTMIDDAESNGAQWSKPNDPRVTQIGKFLRASRLDELPQLWNVLVGDMSFIGPRPERPDFVNDLEKQIPYYELRHLVKPGITGWAQVMFPYGRSVEDALRKLEFDLYYIKNYSLTLDVYILLRTVKTVFLRSGI
jgi:exopolysaccharide biosynthesis polyprenyl glycosylphosphotransferase